MDRRAFCGLFGAAALAGCGGQPLDSPSSTRPSASPTDGAPKLELSLGDCSVVPMTRNEGFCHGELSVPGLDATARVLNGSQLSVRLRNESDGRLGFGPADWTLWYDAESGWTEYVDAAEYDFGASVEPGETYEWLLQLQPKAEAPDYPKTDAGQRFDTGITKIANLPVVTGDYCFVVESFSRPDGEEEIALLVPFSALVG